MKQCGEGHVSHDGVVDRPISPYVMSPQQALRNAMENDKSVAIAGGRTFSDEFKEDHEVMYSLVENTSFPNVIDKKGRSLLYIVCKYGYYRSGFQLVDSRVDLRTYIEKELRVLEDNFGNVRVGGLEDRNKVTYLNNYLELFKLLISRVLEKFQTEDEYLKAASLNPNFCLKVTGSKANMAVGERVIKSLPRVSSEEDNLIKPSDKRLAQAEARAKTAETALAELQAEKVAQEAAHKLQLARLQEELATIKAVVAAQAELIASQPELVASLQAKLAARKLERQAQYSQNQDSPSATTLKPSGIKAEKLVAASSSHS